MNAENYIIVEPNTQKGIVYGTEFVFDVELPGTYIKFVWSTGDGNTFYDQKQIKHTFNYPGIYPVTLSAWDINEQLYTSSVDINVDFAFRDAIKFIKTPETFNHPGKPNFDPFVLSLTSSKIDSPLALILQPFNTKSVPYYAAPDKWRHLVPTWRFLDSNHKVLFDNILHVNTTPIYNEQFKQIAVSATVPFYYIDDLSTDFDSPDVCPLLLGVSLSTLHFTFPPESLIYPYASYSNNETVKAILPWRVTSNLPTSLKISDNGLDDINPTKWVEIPIPSMLTMEFDPAVFDEDIYEWEVPISRVINYPRTNELGDKNPVVVTLSCVNKEAELIPGVHYTVPTDLKFKATDEQGNIAAGYLFTSITPLSGLFVDKSLGGAGLTSGDSFVIQASTVVTNGTNSSLYFEFPKGYPIRNYVFVSHPHGKVINKTIVDSYPRACTSVNYYINQGLTIEEGDLYFLETPALTATNIINLTLSGTAAVYGIAFNPIKDLVYACDADQNTLMLYDTTNVMITSIQLSSYFDNENIGPCHVTLDKKFNVWVSLYDSKRILKFDSKLNFLLSATPQQLLNNPETEMFPPVIETDRFSNLWACWYHDKNSALIKFNRFGKQIAVAENLPEDATPVSLAITPSNTVWVACKRINSLFHYDENGKLLEAVTDKFISPSYIAIDRYARLWVAHGYNLCSLYDTYNKTLQTWKFNAYEATEELQQDQGAILEETLKTKVLKLSSEPIEITAENWLERYTDEMWGGLSVDVFNRVWVIDSVHNVMGVFNPNTPTYISTTEVKPLVQVMPIIKPGNEFTSFVPSKLVRSAQASGDWTGNKWYQKYAKTYDNLPINGTSASFQIYDPIVDFNLAKVNEEFNLSKYIKSLGFTGTLIDSPKFFDEVITGIIGDGDPTKQGLGRIIYEKIANFVLNHSDVETNELPQLMSIADMLGVDYKVYANNLPLDVQRLVNLFSIPKNNLRGILSKKEPENSTEFVEILGHPLTITDLITAESQYIIKDKKTDEYELVTATVDTIKGNVYEVTNLYKGTSITPLFETHIIYRYDRNRMADIYKRNIINWQSNNTTVSWNLSSYEEWYGENGLVEKMFNKILTKQLFDE